MTEKWYNYINFNKLIGCVALDFRKAFDVLPHKILLSKLFLYGCDELSLSWFQSYLHNRSQTVQMNDICSNFNFIRHGVPQGSILGPLLFIIFINDLHFSVKHSSLTEYADDTTLYSFGDTVDELQCKLHSDLHNIVTWCNLNRLVINTDKSKVMVLCTPQKRCRLTNTCLSLYVNNILLENVNCHKILGLHIDNSLSWNDHIQFLSKSLSQLVGLLNRSKHLLNRESKLLFYNSYIHSRFTYCLPIWGRSASLHLDKLWKIQKRALRIINDVPYDAPSKNLFTKSKVLNIREMYCYEICIFIFNILHDDTKNVPVVLNLAKPNENYFLRSTSKKFLLEVPFPRKDIYKKSIAYSGVKVWNSLPDNVRNVEHLSLFKHLCKNHFMVNGTET